MRFSLKCGVKMFRPRIIANVFILMCSFYFCSFSAGANLPPTVSITAPANGAVFAPPALVVIQANATDPDGKVSKVQFFRGSTLLGTDKTAPYSFNWSNVPAGNYV